MMLSYDFGTSTKEVNFDGIYEQWILMRGLRSTAQLKVAFLEGMTAGIELARQINKECDSK